MPIPPDFYDPTLIPTIVGRVDLKAQAAALAAQAFFTPNISGLFDITVELMETQVGAVSSTLGGAGGVTVAHTDVDTNAAQTTSGTIVSGAGTAAANLVGTQLTYRATINAKAGVAVTISVGYTDGGGASHMQYAVHARAVQLV